MSRTKDPTAWRRTAAGVAAYVVVRTVAQNAVDADGYDRGIEANDVLKTWRYFMLPMVKHRQGHELRCEVVSATNIAVCRPGHGPNGHVNP